MSYSEDELLPISALQHLMFCERQCALIHVEQAWSENRLTVEGKLMHERVDERGAETRDGVRTARGVPLQSLRLGLVGKADVVEFRREDGEVWRPFPVEYKRGKPKANRCDEVQLCAQAMCLEEMLDVAVPQGSLFYGTTRRRKDVSLDAELRSMTAAAAERLHVLVVGGRTPDAAPGPRCRNCSLSAVCLPDAGNGPEPVRRYLTRAMSETGETWE